MPRRQVVESTAEERIAAEQWAAWRRTDEAAGSGQRVRIAENTQPRRSE